MPGPVAWPLLNTTTNTGTQSITTTTETVVATLTNINSRGSNYLINFQGSVVFAIQAATTSTTVRLRLGTVTGTIVGSAQVVSGGTAGTQTAGDGTVAGVFTPSQEVANLTVVLTVQAAAAAANWNVTLAQIIAQQ